MARETDRPAGGVAVSKERLYPLLAMLVLALVFAYGARSWATFFLSPEENNGDPIRLFTDTDYPAITIASRIAASGRGGALYDLGAQRDEQQKLSAEGWLKLDPGASLKYPYPYAPYIAVLWAPRAGASPLMGMALWDLLNIAAFAGGLWYLLAGLPLSRLVRLLFLLGGLTGFPFIVNLEQGQSSGLVMFGLGLGIGLLRRGRDFEGGVALGLLVLKVQWLPFLGLVLLWRWRWRALLGMLATALLFTLGVFAAIGTGWIPGFFDMLGRAQRWDPALLLDPWYSHSLSGGLAALLTGGPDATLSPFAMGLLGYVNLGAIVALVGLLLWVWRGKWQPGTAHWDGAMALTVLCAMFTNLQVNTHDLCLLAVPGALGLAYLYARPSGVVPRAIWYALLWVVYLSTELFLPQVFSLPVRPTSLVILLMLALMGWVLLAYRRGEEESKVVRGHP